MTQGLWPIDDDEQFETPREAIDAVVLGRQVETNTTPLLEVMPAKFPLATLLTFLPDVQLKKKLETSVAEALSEDPTTDAGLVAIDKALPDIDQQVNFILERFDGTESMPGPTALAWQLHKRLTGLRADFTKVGVDALAALRSRILAEKRRRDAIADAAKRKAQEDADREARRIAKENAAAAAAANAPKEVVQALKQQAKTATAPPVPSPIAATTLANTTVKEDWRSRFKGTPEDADGQPDVEDMTPKQQEQLKRILAAIVAGDVSINVCAGLNWSYLDKRAASDKSTFNILELEAYDKGGVSKKGRR